MDRKAFYDALRPTLGALTQANVVGFELVLSEAERRRTALNQLAYIIATAWWETGKTMQPVKEAYWLSEAWRRKNLRYSPFYGRGFVQLTWEANYRKASDLYGVDFVANPDLVMEPKHSVAILFDGMLDGWFTGKDLDDYIDDVDESDDEDLREFVNARRIVNGTNRQTEIGKLALVFERALRAAGYGAPVVQPDPAPVPPLPDVEPADAAPSASGGSRSLLQALLSAILALFRK
ncbi:glycoside hydrolase family 19 protein [Amorphus sp. MBR-141]